jgi:hypothetical protein
MNSIPKHVIAIPALASAMLLTWHIHALAGDASANDAHASNSKVAAAAPQPLLHSCDVVMADLTGPFNWNTQSGPTNGKVRYSIGTLACNQGLEPLDWYSTSADHPVMPQNIYRLKNGRFEQIGLGMLKHAFLALQQSFCGTCQSACGGFSCHELGVGCSDPYSAQRNGDPTGLGPRSQVNAATGASVYPHASPSTLSQSSNENGQIHVSVEDINPALNAGAKYYGEAMYLIREETESGNDNNNASYRQILVSSNSGFPLSFTGQTVRELPAIFAWKAQDPAVNIVHIDIPDDGRMTMAWRVTDNGNGTWHYEYALFNMNSDRSGGSFSVPVSDCVQLTNIGFHDVNYHSGEPYDNTDWTVSRANGQLTWATRPYAEDVNANALRWMTMYNFRFDANQGPTGMAEAPIKIGLFKPGLIDSMTTLAAAPTGAQPPVCPADVAPAGGNAVVNIDDLLVVINAWGPHPGAGDVSPACGDGLVNIDDLLAIINAWGPCH